MTSDRCQCQWLSSSMNSDRCQTQVGRPSYRLKLFLLSSFSCFIFLTYFHLYFWKWNFAVPSSFLLLNFNMVWGQLVIVKFFTKLTTHWCTQLLTPQSKLRKINCCCWCCRCSCYFGRFLYTSASCSCSSSCSSSSSSFFQLNYNIRRSWIFHCWHIPYWNPDHNIVNKKHERNKKDPRFERNFRSKTRICSFYRGLQNSEFRPIRSHPEAPHWFK